MRLLLTYFFIFCLLGLTACSQDTDSTPSSVTEQITDPTGEAVADARFAQLKETLAEVYAEDMPGATVVISQGGETIFKSARGMADMEMNVALQPEHILRLASLTKQYTAATILKLVAAGELDLDAPVGDVLPDFHMPELTLHQLLNHTSGLPSYTDVPGYMVSDEIRADVSTAELIALTSDMPLDFTPGSEWRYNNSAYVVLGAVIEKVTGLSWHQAMQEMVFEPLGLEATGYYSAAEIVAGRVEGYMQEEKLVNAPFISMTQPHAAGALSASASDVDKWQQALHNGKVLPDAMYARMTDTSNGFNDYGYGIASSKLRGETMLSHSGGIHGFSTYALWLPQQQVSVVVLSNNMGHSPGAAEVALRLAAQVIGKPFPIEKPSVELAEKALRELVGTYSIGADEQRTLSWEDGVLYSQRQGGRKYAVRAVGDDQFVLEDSLVYFTVRRNDDGTVEGVEFYQIGATEPEFSEKVSDEVAVRSVIELSEEQAARLIGDYQLQPGFIISVRYTDAGITAQATGQSAFLVNAESPTVLFNEQFGIVMEFQLPEQGSAEQLTLIQGGQELPAPRIANNEEGE